MKNTAKLQTLVSVAKDRQQNSITAWLKCCATCYHLDAFGYCDAFDDSPPINFLEKENDCKDYEKDISF